MKTKIIVALSMLTFLFSNCASLELPKFAASTEDGITYEYEGIVPLTNFVRIRPITPSDQLTGEVTIPSTVSYEGTTYVVSQIAAQAFANYDGITKIVLPPTVSTIEAEAFRGCTMLSQINTPQPLSTIGDYAFEGCSSLAAFSFVASISTLGQCCFANCSSLGDISLPTSLNTIPYRAFYGCSNVSTIFIDATVNSIGAEAFAGCRSVIQITCKAGMPPTASANTFDLIDAEIPVTVPMGGLNYYATAIGWNHFVNFQGVY